MSKFISVSSFRLLPLVALMPASLAFASEPVQPAAPVATLPTTVVTATRIAQPIDQVIGDISVIERADLERFQGQSAFDALQGQSGIQVVNSGGAGQASSVQIRGSSNAQTLVIIDGIRYGSATIGTPALQHIPADQIERIEILRGTAASLYGADAIGGVIQIFTRQAGDKQNLSLTVGAGTQNTRQASMSTGGQFGATTAQVSLASNSTDGINAVRNLNAFGYNPDRDGYRNHSIGLNISQQLHDSVDIGLSGLLSESRNQYDSSADQNVSLNQNGAGNLWATVQLNPNLQSELRIGESVDDGEFVEGPDRSRFKTQQRQYQLQNTLRLAAGQALLGVERLEQNVSGTTAYTVDQRNVNSAFIGYQAQLSALGLQLNLRHDENSQYGEKTTYTAATSWTFSPAWRVGASTATGFRAPDFGALYFPNFGNPDLKPEQSENVEGFLEYRTAQSDSKVVLYRNDIKDANQARINVAKVVLRGASLTHDWQNERLQAGFVYDYLDAENRSRGVPLLFRAEHSGTVYTGVRTNDWQARAEVQAVGSRFKSVNQQLGGYALLNLSSEVRLRPTVKLGVRLNNLLDKDYVLNDSFGTVYNTLGVNGLISLTYTPK